jgi:hypothetical protein
MLPTLKYATYLTLTGSTLLLAAAGRADAAAPTIAQRTAVATAVATTSPYCKALKPFYWEIGNKSGPLSSGTGGDKSAPYPTATTVMSIASASKWIFATYVVEKQQGVLATEDVKRLNMTSGYTNFNTCSLGATVSSCLSEPGRNGGTNGEYVPSTDGKFFYDGAHMQNLADYVGLGQDGSRVLGTAVKALLGSTLPLAYNQPQLAGGGMLSAGGYAQFLRNMLGGKYPHMLSMLSSYAVCAHANSTDCPTALYSPANQSAPGMPNNKSNLAYHYGLGHWIEDDPTQGDGAFSSEGKAGFYPWIDKTKTYYGVLAPNDPAALKDASGSQGAPIYCGQAIRRAWMQPGTVATNKK